MRRSWKRSQAALARLICEQDDDDDEDDDNDCGYGDDVRDGDCNETKKRIFKQRWLRNNLKFVKSNMSSAKIVAIYAFILDKMNKMGTFSKQNIWQIPRLLRSETTFPRCSWTQSEKRSESDLREEQPSTHALRPGLQLQTGQTKDWRIIIFVTWPQYSSSSSSTSQIYSNFQDAKISVALWQSCLGLPF